MAPFLLSSSNPLVGHAGLRWAAFFTAVLGAWAALFALAAGHLDGGPAERLGPGMGLIAPLLGGAPIWGGLEALCLTGPAAAQSPLSALIAMWSLMALAMMAPTAAPLLKAYGDLVSGNPAKVPAGGWWAFLLGFLAVWLGFAALAGLAHWALGRTGLVSAAGLIEVPWLAAALLAAAGLYQFSALKAACLTRCRSPLAFFLSHWRDGPAGALTMGLRSGLDCLGCCWALMLLAFVGGTMNLVWMGLAMLLMTLEKLPALGQAVSKPLGAALLALAIVTL